MELYLLIIIYIIILAILVFYKKTTTIRKKVFLILSFSILFLLMGFRTETVGTDTSLYCRIFEINSSNTFKELILSGDTSIIYSLYNKIISFISTDRKTIIFFNSLIICILTPLFIYKNSKNVVFSTIFFLTFYHYFASMNITRQYIAVLIVANSFYFLKNKQLTKYIITCLIATFIHNTAIISFMLIPFFYIKPNKKNTYIYIIILVISLLFLDKLFIIFSNIFSHYTMYFEKDYLTTTGQNRKIIITAIYFVFSIIISSLLKSKKLKLDNDFEFQMLHILNLIAIVFGILSLKIMLVSRIEVYFAIFAIIMIPKVFDLLKNRIMYYFLFTLIMIIPMYLQLKSNNSEVLPYETWIFELLKF